MIKRTLYALALVVILILVDVSAVQGDSLPESAYISGVHGHAQKHQLSCEARSSADLAAFWGISLGENEFLQALPQADNPEQGFVGDPDGAWGNVPPYSYGVHAGPVAETLHSFGLQADAHNHLSWDDLRGEIYAGHPVIVWIIGQMWGGRAIEYEAPDGSTSVVAAFEHTMILTGYSPDTVQVVDAFSGQQQTYSLKTFLDSWVVLGNMAIFSSPATQEGSAPAGEVSPPTYTVQTGDYLTALADQFGTSLEKLVELNAIPYPYTIYPGQVLLLPSGEAPPPPADMAEPPPITRSINFKVRLPLVHRDYAVQVNTSKLIAYTPTASSKASSNQDINRMDRSCAIPSVDEALLTRLTTMLKPTWIEYGVTLLR